MGEFDHLRSERDIRREAPFAKPLQTKQDPHGLLALQRLAGNSAVSSLLVQRQGDSGAPDQSGAAAPAGGDAMMTIGALSKPGTISYTLQNGQVTDASARIGSSGGS